MTILNHAVSEIIAQFGENILIVPTSGYGTEDDIWYTDEGHQDEEAFEVKARVFRVASDEELEEHGFSTDVDGMLYFDDVTVGKGDLIILDEGKATEEEMVVVETMTSRLGDGIYRQNCAVRRRDI